MLENSCLWDVRSNAFIPKASEEVSRGMQGCGCGAMMGLRKGGLDTSEWGNRREAASIVTFPRTFKILASIIAVFAKST